MEVPSLKITKRPESLVQGSQGCDTQGNYSEGVETRSTPEGSLFGSSS